MLAVDYCYISPVDIFHSIFEWLVIFVHNIWPMLTFFLQNLCISFIDYGTPMDNRIPSILTRG